MSTAEVKLLQKRCKDLEYENQILKSGAPQPMGQETVTLLLRLVKKNVGTLVTLSESLNTGEELSYATLQRVTDALKTKRYVPEKVKKQIYVDQNYKCNICGETLSASCQVDHIIPLYQGGSNDRDNLQGVCSPCHDAKTTQDFQDFYFKISKLYDKLN